MGLQVRKRVLLSSDNQRYYFLSKDSNIRLNDQIPLAVFFPGEWKHNRIALAEGVGAKPFLTCEGLSVPVIGAAGGNWASSEVHLQNTINQLKLIWSTTTNNTKDLVNSQHNGLKNKEELLFTTNEERHPPPLKSQTPLLNVGNTPSNTSTRQQSSCLTSNCSTQLKAKDSSSLQTTSNSTVLKYNPSKTQHCQPAALQSHTQIEIVITPDAGSVKNKLVVKQYRRVANLLTSWGYTVTFAWWGQVDKSFPDIDELQPERYEEIRYLSICEFKALCIKWGGLKSEQESSIIQFDYEQQVALAQKKLHSLTYPADIVCNPNEKYLPNLLGKIPLQGIVAIKAPKGSGKSHQIKQIKNHCCGCWSERTIYPEIPQLPPEQLSLFDISKPQDAEVTAPEPEIERIYNKGLGMKFLSINARIALGRAQAVQWDFTWIEDADIDAQSEFGSAKISRVSVLENIDQIGLCWDSLGKVFGRDWSNTLVVIDEIELGLNHLTTSSTCKDRRSFILHTLEVKLKECLENNGLVVIADADLTDSSIDYLKKITGTTPFIVNHEFKGDPWEVEFYTGKRDELISQIEDWVSNENCEPIAVCMDNQKEAEALALHLINKYPYLEQEKNGLIRIDSKTTQTDFGREFVKHANEKNC